MHQSENKPETKHKPIQVTNETHDNLLRLKYLTKVPIRHLVAQAVEKFMRDYDATHPAT